MRISGIFLLIALAAGLIGQTQPGAPSPGSPVEPPTLEHIAAVAPDILAIEVQAGRIVPMRQVPYQKEAGDVVTQTANSQTGEIREIRVVRNGYPLGWLIGKDRNILVLYDRLVGTPLDTSVADNPRNYIIRSVDDPAYARGGSPNAVWRKSKSNDWTDAGDYYVTRHYLYLKLPAALKSGKGYTVQFGALKLNVSSAGYVHDDGSNRSEAVHASQIGYRPDDVAKSAFLSIWLGTGGAHAYPPGLTFYLKDEATGERVYTGKVALAWAAATPEEIGRKVNNNKTDVYRMDFGEFQRPGAYSVCVEGIGCSYPFEIAPDVWTKAFALSMKGFYHQRNGIALTAPYTDYIRPRGYHPDDGVKVYQSTCPLMYSGNGLNALGLDRSNFGCLTAGKTDQIVENAWGGYMDAGDWDRKIEHLSASRLHLELMELFPEQFRAVSLNLPESGNGLPDLLNEALYNIDFYRRLQTPEGGIRGGIEQSEHPYGGLVSWLDTQVSMAYAPDPWCSYIYAGVAARAALALERLGSSKVAGYRESALKAMRWADAEFAKWKAGPDFAKARRAASAIPNERALAAIELYRLTKDKQWHEAFLADGAPAGADGKRTMRNLDAAFVYARLEDSLADAAIRKLAVETIMQRADEAVKLSKGSAFGFTTAGRSLSWGALTVPADTALVRAHVLTGRPEYLETILRSALYSAGANPLNMTMTTGLGHDWPRHLLHEDSRHFGQPAPVGITIYGPSDPGAANDNNAWGFKRLQTECTPPVLQWPAMEAYFDVYQWAEQNEFTVNQTMGPSSYVWGYLGARR
ncbi:MAG: glycoside hydrolase family 9 protein [Bryobacteraceae bacterium]